MSFYIETTKIDLGYTAIENIFLTEFMPLANGTYVKVYLLGYKFAKNNDPNLAITNHLLSKELNIPLSDVLDAWNYWEDKGIINKHSKDNDDSLDKNNEDYIVEFKNLTQLYISTNSSVFNDSPVEKPASDSSEQIFSSPKSTVNDLISLSKNKHISDMFNQIDHIIRRQLQSSERLKVLDWIKIFNMEPDVIVRAFHTAYESKGIANVNYVNGIITNWYDLKIITLDDLNNYIKKTSEKHYNYELIKKSIGYPNTIPTKNEQHVIDRWFEDWGFSLDVILKACDKSINTTNPSINYINGVLDNWKEKGFKTLDDVLSEKSASTSNPISKYTNTKKVFKTNFHNFEQQYSNYTDAELELLIKNKQTNTRKK